jgi:DNA polymerase-3 subunit delta
LIEESIASSNPLYKAVAKKATVKDFPVLKDAKLREWVQKRVVEEGGDITPRAANLLVRLVGSNLWAMSGEVNKLVLYTAGRRIEEDDVRTMVGYTEQYSVFNMVDAILEFRAEQAEQYLQQQLDAGAAPVYLLTMLARQVRLIVLSKELNAKKVPRAEMMKRLGVTNDFVVRKTQEQANRYSMERLKEVYHKILECDVSIKTGKLPEELSLNILVAELARKPAGAAATRTRTR